MKNDPKHTGIIPWFNAWLLHKGGDRYNQLTDERKRSLFSGLTGRVLEIGPGAGTNLKYYPDDVSYIGLEPNPYMQNYLKEEAKKMGKSIDIIPGKAEDIPLNNESFDTVVSTLVLCSVSDMQLVLAEIQRVLKPGGSFLFMEHVAAHKGSFLRKMQRGIKPVWKYMADGCHPDRETWSVIEKAGFEEVNINHFHLSLPVVGPQIMGKAVKK